MSEVNRCRDDRLAALCRVALVFLVVSLLLLGLRVFHGIDRTPCQQAHFKSGSAHTKRPCLDQGEPTWGVLAASSLIPQFEPSPIPLVPPFKMNLSEPSTNSGYIRPPPLCAPLMATRFFCERSADL